jgi:DNA-binding transcriptional MerR regulator
LPSFAFIKTDDGKERHMSDYLLISDAAKEVKVESHVLRYWEEELHLPIKRNELGHRYYTKEDVERFKQIKGMKEKGLQLKAIKTILKDDTKLAVDLVPSGDNKLSVQGDKEEKSRRLQWLLQQLIRETLQENNDELCREIKDSVVKELDYQFRMQEEREEARDKKITERDEEHYKRMDELLRKKSRSKFRLKKREKHNAGKMAENKA